MTPAALQDCFDVPVEALARADGPMVFAVRETVSG